MFQYHASFMEDGNIITRIIIKKWCKGHQLIVDNLILPALIHLESFMRKVEPSRTRSLIFFLRILEVPSCQVDINRLYPYQFFQLFAIRKQVIQFLFQEIVSVRTTFDRLISSRFGKKYERRQGCCSGITPFNNLTTIVMIDPNRQCYVWTECSSAARSIFLKNLYPCHIVRVETVYFHVTKALKTILVVLSVGQFSEEF